MLDLLHHILPPALDAGNHVCGTANMERSANACRWMYRRFFSLLLFHTWMRYNMLLSAQCGWLKSMVNSGAKHLACSQDTTHTRAKSYNNCLY
jgi:hypothetical protein